MATYKHGYDEERFVNKIDRNFFCLICFNVLRDPVMCPRNHHCFCRGCITKHLVENSQRCPTCADPLTVETLAEPQRLVKDYLDEAKIRCGYINRGCHEIVQLQHLDRHESTCGFQPVVCTNEGCGVTVSRRDLIHHESELCEVRKLKCHSCGEMSKTLTDMEKRMAKMESSNADIEGKLEAVNNEVRGLKTAMIEGFDQMKEALIRMEETKEPPRKVRRGASGDTENKNIIVAGGQITNSVEMFNWRQKLWSPLPSMPDNRDGATSFVYNNHLTIAGGLVDTIIRMNIDQNPDRSICWDECSFKLPAELAFHSNVLYNDQLVVAGGHDENLDATSDCIYGVQLVPPYAVRTLSRMPEPRQNHSTEIFDDNLLIVGGRTTGRCQDSLKSVVLYDIKKNECKQLIPLDYEVSEMATVKWRDNIVVIGGVDRHGNVLNTVVLYNVKTEQSHMLPPMTSKRRGCAAVVIENNIVVLGGDDEQWRDLKSAEAFRFDTYKWEKLPDMSKARWFPTAVVM